MEMLIILLVGSLVWLVCGIISAGFEFAYLQGEYPSIAEMCYEEDRRWVLTKLMPFGVLGLIVILFHKSYKYGWKNPFKSLQ